jgi:hypothetical protein
MVFTHDLWGVGRVNEQEKEIFSLISLRYSLLPCAYETQKSSLMEKFHKNMFRFHVSFNLKKRKSTEIG